ncbi:MAG: galactose-1-phosphate uridylyltransferase [Bacteroidetes bacterium]|nr:galactose-1-phosphate uridylyltransferase [Bacteroidota bacterium]
MEQREFDFKNDTHRRFNPLIGEWVLVSPHRAKRPWLGKEEEDVVENHPAYDSKCYLCPGNVRANGIKNPDYTGPYVFDNDFAAIRMDCPDGKYEEGELFKTKSEKGICKVVCFSPKHNLTIPEMSVDNIKKLIDIWQSQFSELKKITSISNIQIFENKGSVMGCSNPHPHCQIWAQESIPVELSKEGCCMKQYYSKHKRTLLTDYLTLELKKKERIVIENEHFVALVPFWAVWPYEIMIVSKHEYQDITQFNDEVKKDFAEMYKKVTIMYDNLFETSFPYSAGIHQCPTNGEQYPEWHFHMHFYPPLLRSAKVKKFMVGYEMLAEPQRDISAEISAEILRNLSKIHYKNI